MWRTPFRSTGKVSYKPALYVLFTSIFIALLVGCGVTPNGVQQSNTGVGGGVSQWGFPYKTGTQIKIGMYALHDDNFGSFAGGYTLAGAGTDRSKGDVTDASLDLLTAAAPGTPVIPLAAGRVLSAWPECHAVLIDHFNGTWVVYLHLQQIAVSQGVSVSRDSVIGYTMPGYVGDSTCRDHSDWPHVHFAFISGSGHSGRYVSMAGRNLCGHTVNSDGSISGLGIPNGAYFAVPNCDSGSGQTSSHDGEQFVSQSANPTTVSVGQPVTISFTEQNSGTTTWSDNGGYRLSCVQNCFGLNGAGFGGQNVSPGQSFQFNITFPFSFSAGTYRTVWVMTHNGNTFGHDLWIDIKVVAASVNPPPPTSSSCSTPSLQGPWDGATYSTSDSISLSWSTDCPVSYAEMWGGPTGTLNFGGWQSGSSIFVGTMWPGTYQWHVKGRSSSGVETGWSNVQSFTIGSVSQPPTSTPAPPNPVATDTPYPTPTPYPTTTPYPTPTNTPCPYINNNGQFPTFYSQTNWQGQSVTYYLNPGQDLFFVFPTWLQQNLESFTDPYSAFHIVTLHTTSFGGNFAHWDTGQPGPLQAVDGYQYSASVEIYFRRSC